MELMSRYIAFLFALISFELHGQAGVSPAKEVNIFGRSELSSAKEVDISTSQRPRAPANLEISDVTFSDQHGNSNSILDADEEAEIRFTLSNVGKGNALAVAANVVPVNPMEGIELSSKKQLGDLFAGDSMHIALPIKGVPLLETGKAELEIRIEEANGFDSDPIRLVFNTQRMKIPEISIADYTFTSNDGDRITLGHPISLTVMLQNKGQGDAV